MQGEVKFYLVLDGFGFLEADDGREFFVHSSQVPEVNGKRRLEKGQRVEFDLGKHKGRVVAVRVHPVADGEDGG